MNQTYIVKRGDTLYGISNQFGVSVTDLANLNNVNATSLQVGQVLIIPNKSGINPDNMFMYTVKKGDTLYGIAKKYNTTTDAIRSLNNLNNSNLSVGQVLRIPENYIPSNDMELPNYINYTVKRGDTLYKIARDNNISVDTLITDNSLSNNVLTIGQNLRIRVTGETSGQIEECFGEDFTPQESESYTTYTVKKGDSLYSIANRYNTSVSAITKLNNLKSTTLSIGQVLKIPTSGNSNTVLYTVKKGDSLYAIARRFNTTVDSIKRKNNLASNNLSIGQQLII